MADKVNVKANSDFYDRGNAIPRTKGQEFVLRKEYAEELGEQVKVLGDYKEPEKVLPQPQQKAQGKQAQDSEGQPLVEKVKAGSQAKAAPGPQGKDITMDNVQTQGEEAPKKANVPAAKPASKAAPTKAATKKK